jgi:hypothetical protein
MTIREWLNEDPPKEIIAKMTDGNETVEYIPIGQVEKMLDEKFDWDTTDSKFQIYKTGTYWFASGSVLLSVCAWSEVYNQVRQGAATIIISSKDDNQHYESTILSLATANAAQKLGKRFGRELNGRMEVGETAFKNITTPEVIDRSVERVKILIENAKNLAELSQHKEHCKEGELYTLYCERVKKLSI